MSIIPSPIFFLFSYFLFIYLFFSIFLFLFSPVFFFLLIFSLSFYFFLSLPYPRDPYPSTASTSFIPASDPIRPPRRRLPRRLRPLPTPLISCTAPPSPTTQSSPVTMKAAPARSSPAGHGGGPQCHPPSFTCRYSPSSPRRRPPPCHSLSSHVGLIRAPPPLRWPHPGAPLAKGRAKRGKLPFCSFTPIEPLQSRGC